MASTVTQGITNHYLQVQALSPASPTTTFTDSQTKPSFNWFATVTPAFIIFTVLLIAGIIGLLVTHTKNINKLLVVVSIAFLTSLVPVSLNIVNQQTSIVSRAGAGNIPKNLIVDQVTSMGFNVSWQTDKASVGAIKLREAGQPEEYNQIIAENKDSGIYTHIIRVTDLKPSTTYYFEVLSGGEWYNHQDKPLTVITVSR